MELDDEEDDGGGKMPAVDDDGGGKKPAVESESAKEKQYKADMALLTSQRDELARQLSDLQKRQQSGDANKQIERLQADVKHLSSDKDGLINKLVALRGDIKKQKEKITQLEKELKESRDKEHQTATKMRQQQYAGLKLPSAGKVCVLIIVA